MDVKRIRILFIALAVFLGLFHAFASRYEMNPDGMSYLDIGAAYTRGDWDTAINTYWSPLYSWILGFTVFIFNPPPYWEFSLVHLVNFIIYLGALFAFSFFLRELRNHNVSILPSAFEALGYT